MPYEYWSQGRLSALLLAETKHVVERSRFSSRLSNQPTAILVEPPPQINRGEAPPCFSLLSRFYKVAHSAQERLDTLCSSVLGR